jgi:hypothetical protein
MGEKGVLEDWWHKAGAYFGGYDRAEKHNCMTGIPLGEV